MSSESNGGFAQKKGLASAFRSLQKRWLGTPQGFCFSDPFAFFSTILSLAQPEVPNGEHVAVLVMWFAGVDNLIKTPWKD